MFIAKGLAEAQDGTLVVSSEGLGLGATFCLILKLATVRRHGGTNHSPLKVSSITKSRIKPEL